MLEVVESGHIEAQRSQAFGGFGSDDIQFAPIGRAIGDLDVLVDKIAFEMRNQTLGLRGVRVNPERRFGRIDENVSKNATFDIRDSRSAALAGL